MAGISKSGAASGAFLLDRGAQVLLYDDLAADGVKKAMTELAARGARIVRAEELSAAAEECDVLVLSPGIPIDHELPVAFRKKGKRILGEASWGACTCARPSLR